MPKLNVGASASWSLPWSASTFCVRSVSVWWLRPRASLKNQAGYAPGRKESSLATKSLYVGNLSYSATEDEVRNLFEPYGPIAEIRIIQNKGFGFVDIPEENVAAAIEATNGKELGGRTLTVNEARPRTERGGGGGFGGRSRGW